MSRIGNAKITIPQGVEVTFKEGVVTVKGSKGELMQEIDSCVSIKIEENEVSLSRETDTPQHRAKHGLYRSLINNMVIGVSEGYKKELEVIGVGYRAVARGQQLGYSHDIYFDLPNDIKATAERTSITIEGADKQLVGSVASKIRSFRSPEPYKGKGIRYKDEYVKIKQGKTVGE